MYKIRLYKYAAKYYAKLDEKAKRRINSAMEDIMGSPAKGPRIKGLKGELEGKYRYDAGGIRIIYTIAEDEPVVYVLAIGPRGDVYKK